MNSTVKSTDRVVLGICLVISFALSWIVHDKFSWGADDGFYAYMAEHMAAGDVIHKDLQVLHPGLLYFFHEQLFKIFDEGFVSLRYPLIIVTMVQTALAFKIARPFGLLTAIAAAIALTAFSFVQFVNATPNWYLVFFAILIGYVVDRTDPTTKRSLLFVGFLIGISFLFRQLTGVFFAMAVTAALFLKLPHRKGETDGKAGTIILGFLGVALAIYLFNSAKPIGLLLFGLWPPIFLFCAAIRCDVTWPSALKIIIWLVVGAIVAALPLVIYHLATGSFSELIEETFIAPFTYHALRFVSENSYAQFPYIALRELMDGQLWAVFGLIYWVVLLLLNALLAIIVIRKTLDSKNNVSAIAVLAIFHSLVALIVEIPLYLNYIVGPVLLALLIVSQSDKRRTKLAILTITVSVVAIAFGAGQPMERGRVNTILLKKTDWASQTIPGTSLFASEETAERYAKIIEIIDACSKPNDTLYAFPSNPDIYAFSARKSALRFTGSYLGLTSSDQLANASERIASSSGPALIFHNKNDVYNTDLASDLFAHVHDTYRLLETIEPFDVYVRIDREPMPPLCHSRMNR